MKDIRGLAKAERRSSLEAKQCAANGSSSAGTLSARGIALKGPAMAQKWLLVSQKGGRGF